jgi:hypothetical protein
VTPSPSDTGPGRSVLVIAAIAVVATLLFSWATWALFLAPRDGGDTIESFVETLALELREGDFDAVRERLDPAFTFDPGGLDRDAALAVARSEFAAGRFHPYVALTHPVVGGVDDVSHYAVLGILAQGNPEKNRNVNVLPVRLELKVREKDGGFILLSARSRLGR